jgi:colicin import membrane protein
MSPPGPAGARRSMAVLLSIIVHAGIVAALAWSWWRWREPPRAPEPLAIEATVVLQRATTAAPATASAPVKPPEPAAPPEPPPPEPSAKAEAEAKRAAEQARREQEEREEAARQEAARQKEQQEEAERQKQEAATRAAQEQEQRAAKDKARREAELRAQLAAEERTNAARGSAEAAAWLALIRDKVTRNWIRPPSARAGVNCEVHVTQVPGGAVTGVQIGSCNGDAAVRESIEAAVYRASPLPTPSNPDLFDRNLIFNFHPDE